MVEPPRMVKTISNESCGSYISKPDVELGNATMLTAVIQGEGFGNVTISNGQVDGVDISTIPRHLKASYVEQEEAVSTWTTVAFSGSQVLYKVIWAAELGLFVGVSSSTPVANTVRILTSPDGINWTNHNAPVPGIRGVCWSPELKLLVAVFISVSGFTRILTSTDGSTWVQSTETVAPELGWQSVAWSPKLGLFAAFDAFHGGLVSRNGYNWTRIQQQGPTSFGLTRDLIWCDELGLFVGVAAAYDTILGLVDSVGGSITSSNGYTWKHNAGPPGMWFGLAYSPELGILVAVDNGPTNNVMTSVDGKRWVVRPAPSSAWRSVSWSPQLGVFVAIANGGTYRTMWSRDGINWVPNTVMASDEPYMTTLDWSPELGRFAQLGPANVALISTLVVPRSKSTLLVSPAHASFDRSGNLTMTTRVKNAPGSASQPSFGFQGDGFGMYAPSANVLGFSTGAVERLRVDDAGVHANTLNVYDTLNASTTGLVVESILVDGAANAILYLDEDGAIQASTVQLSEGTISTGAVAADPGSSAKASYHFAHNANTGIYSPLPSSIGLTTSGTERVRVTSTGFVGVNTTAPSEQLHVVGNVLVNGNVSVAGAVTAPSFQGNAATVQTLAATTRIDAPNAAFQTVSIGSLSANSSNLLMLISSNANISNLTSTSVVAQSLQTVAAYVQGNLRVGGSLLVDSGNTVLLYSETQISDQLIVNNAGTGPALKVTQTGVQPIAEFYDDDVLTMKMYDGGSVAIASASGPSLVSNVNPLGALLGVFGDIESTGNISGANVNATELVVAPTFRGNVDATSLAATGNISGANVNATELVVAPTFRGNVDATTVTTTTLAATGNISGANVNATALVVAPTFRGNVDATSLAATGNISGANVNATGLVVAPTFRGNVDATTLAATGNISGANVNVTVLAVAPTFRGNVNATTISTSTLAATGNVTSGNLSVTGTITAPTFTAGNVNANTIYARTFNGTTPAFVPPSKMLNAPWGGTENTLGALGTLEVSQIVAVADVAGSLNNTYFAVSAPTLTSGLIDYTLETSDQFTVWFNVGGAGVQPTVANTVTYVPVSLATDATATAVAAAISTALSAFPALFKAGVEGATVRIAAQRPGILTDIGAGTSGFSAAVLVQGSGSLGSGDKYSGAVTGPNGKIYMIPEDATNVGIIDPATGAVDTTKISGLASTTNKWRDGVLAGGKIYCIPHTATTVLIIDCATDTSQETSITGLSGTNKWAGGALDRTGRYIYCAPYDSTSVLIIDTLNNTADTTSITGLTGTAKWIGAVLAPTGKIYMVPHNATTVLIVDPVTNTAEQTSITGLTGTTKWWGGCLAPNGKIYCSPSSSASVMIIDPATNTTNTTSITGLTTAAYKWLGNPTVAPNGKLYFPPCGSTNNNSTNILVVDPVFDTFTTITGVAGSTKYMGSALGPSGQVFFAPNRARYVLTVDTGVQAQLGTKQATITGAATTVTTTNLTASKALVSDAAGKIANAATSAVELGYLVGTTSLIQTQLGTKQATITGAATTVTTTDLTASKALVSDAAGKIANAATSAVELGYLVGTTSLIQTQLGTKANITAPSFIGPVTITGGFVGIGTVAPSEQLHVVGNVLVTGSLNANTGTFSNIVTGSLSATTGEFALEDLVLSGDTNRIIYSDADGALRTSTASMTDTGNVNVAGSVTVLGGTAASPGFLFSNTNAGTFSPGSDQFAVSTGGTERVRVDSAGRVGIGTTAPSAGNALHVVGNIFGTESVIANTGLFGTLITTTGNVAANAMYANIGTAALPSYSFASDANTGTFSPASNIFAVSTGGLERVRVNADGYVGLGIDAPIWQLDLSTDGARKLTTTTWLTGSDARVKDDIELANLSMCYDTVKSIPLKRFAWKESFAPLETQEDRRVLGWIAQDVEQVFAKAVTSSAEHGLEDFRTLNSDQLVKAMWGALQKLISDKEALEARLAAAGF